MGTWYTTREAVKAALDFRETARNNGQVDRAVEAASRAVESCLHRKFYPWTGTRYLDWPNGQGGKPWRLWLDSNEVASVSALVAGGVTLPPSGYILRRSDRQDTPPYTHIEVDLSTPSVFAAGTTHQRSIAITGVFIGCPLTESPAGALAEALDVSETSVDVTDSALVGVGSILRVGTERMIVTGKTMLDTAQDLGADLAATNSDVTVPVTTGAAYTVDETILIDSERMLVVDVAGNNLTVKRAFDGSVLATHAAGADIYAPRSLTVERGALGTTAATHLTAAALVSHVVPGPVAQYALGLAINDLLGQSSGYARVIGEGDNAREASGRGLRDLKAAAYAGYGRKFRKKAV